MILLLLHWSEASEGRISHEDAMRSLQEFTAGGVDEDAVLLAEGPGGGQTLLSPGTPVPALPDRDSEQTKHIKHSSTILMKYQTWTGFKDTVL